MYKLGEFSNKLLCIERSKRQKFRLFQKFENMMRIKWTNLTKFESTTAHT